jgi:biopolymer transport protein TolR
MAISLNGKSQSRGRYRPLSEINVTPLVDVMLVLLIIFMVTAPLMTSGVSVNLPNGPSNPVNPEKPLSVNIDASGKIYLQDQEVQPDELITKLKAITQDNQDRQIFVRGDKDLPYGRIMNVMANVMDSGFTKAVLVGNPSGTPSAKPAVTRPKAG